MKELSCLVEETSTEVDKIHLLCVDEKLPLLQRYKLTEIIRSKKARKHVQHFSEFIKNSLNVTPTQDLYINELLKKL
jgi:hypothetical protein